MFSQISLFRTGLTALSLAAISTELYAQVDLDRREMLDARKQRKELLSQRHNMKDPKTRATVVQQLREADQKFRAAVHRRAKAKGLKIEGDKPNGGRFVLVDFDEKGTPIYDETMNVDAAITTAADVVRGGKPFRPNLVEGEIAYPNSHSGIQLESCSDAGGGQNIAYIDDGDWVEYTINVPAPGEYWMEVRTASNNNAGGSIHLSSNGNSIGSITVPDTNGWQSWKTTGTYVTFATSGSQILRMDFAGGSGSLFNVNWFNFSKKITIGLWEAGGVPRVTHRELSGHVTVMDSSTETSNHATHVAGTLVSRGVNAATLGMAPQAFVAAFSSSGAETEMLANGAAVADSTDISVSNHSYGSTRGWRKDDDDGWQWKGEYSPGGNQADFYDKNFGRYSDRSEKWDDIAYNLPYYLIFVSAGNERENVPNSGDSWTYVDNFSTITVPSYNPSLHPLGNRYYKGDDKGYDTMEGGGLAKNAIAVGSSDEGIDGSGVRDPDEAEAQRYSCRGPADDGRIKPDIHANGSGLTSSIASSNTATASYSGTSMSSPNVCGSAALLIDYYRSLIPNGDMRASTLKALILHTADDRGKAGPDYKYGWGIMNTEAAANVIKSHASNAGGGTMLEATVNDTTHTHTFAWDGTSPLRVTLCWTDPAGDEIDDHDSRERNLVNDLNLSVTRLGGTTHLPYVMPYVGNWSNSRFESAATTGVNTVDNVEQVYLSSPAAGTYVVTVDFAGTLTNDSQNYSLIVTGQTAPEIVVEENGPPVVPLVNNSGVRDFGAAAPSQDTILRDFTIRNIGGSPLTGLTIGKTGPQSGDFTVGSLSANELETGEAASFTVLYDPLGTGTRTAALQIASNDADEDPFIIHLTANGRTELEAWRFTHFGTTANTGDAADDFDFDSDSLANLAEFGLATDPKVPNTQPFTFALAAAQAELEYSRSIAAMADYNIDVVWSDDLASEMWSTTGVTEEILSDDGSVQDVKALIPRDSADKRFFRIEISPK